MPQYYIVKVKGTAKIPDFIQVRDSNFTLVAHFRSDQFGKNLQKLGIDDKQTEFQAFIDALEFGKVTELDI